MSEWISVKERVPERKGEYFVYSTFAGYGYRRIAFFSPCYDGYEEYMQGKRVWYACDREYGDCEIHVTHWMPLPEPPKEG